MDFLIFPGRRRGRPAPNSGCSKTVAVIAVASLEKAADDHDFRTEAGDDTDGAASIRGGDCPGREGKHLLRSTGLAPILKGSGNRLWR
jgi:hypothetical protein